ncbi:MAG: hypothetical protein JSW09_03900, partial [Pseudomonadota bacterium]
MLQWFVRQQYIARLLRARQVVDRRTRDEYSVSARKNGIDSAAVKALKIGIVKHRRDRTLGRLTVVEEQQGMGAVARSKIGIVQ